jgi:hypothetical protein
MIDYCRARPHFDEAATPFRDVGRWGTLAFASRGATPDLSTSILADMSTGAVLSDLTTLLPPISLDDP